MSEYNKLCENILAGHRMITAHGVKNPAVYMNEETFRMLKDECERGSIQRDGYIPTIFGMKIKVNDIPKGMVFLIQDEEAEEL